MGRPPGRIQDHPFQMRVSDDFLAAVDGWSEKQSDKPARAEAIRRLVAIGLAVPAKTKRTTDKARKAASIAAETAAMDQMHRILKDHPPGVRKARMKQLTSMPGGIKKR